MRKRWYNVYTFDLTPDMKNLIIMDGEMWDIHLTEDKTQGTIAALPDKETWLWKHIHGLFGNASPSVLKLVGQVNRQ